MGETDGISGKEGEEMKELIIGFSLVGICFGGYFYVENRYAHCADVKQIEQKFDYRFKVIEIKGTNERIWQLEAELKKNPGNKTAAEELKKLREEKSLMTEELKELGKKK